MAVSRDAAAESFFASLKDEMYQFDDGSYLSEIVAGRDYYRRADPITVRVVEYTLGADETVYRLATTVLDPAATPARELAALYTQRWEIETALDELKTHQGGAGFVLRSQHPSGVEQEIYGFLLTHHAPRSLMHDTALAAEIDPDRLSFLRTLRLVRRQVTDQAGFSPTRLKRSLQAARDEILRLPLPKTASTQVMLRAGTREGCHRADRVDVC
ncbi:Transposase DDE domain-containing protein [Saccharopolyspora shandongensis]|uniref:Transposase DDE domain-containing protein n=1 Tax=Saccharopolyspora shandongensis TaxID=418495 RepID=A0A1H3TF50_9PSEU|nr:Transposase DDE domain-containing protein [Saccharopolyspora shandongensis]